MLSKRKFALQTLLPIGYFKPVSVKNLFTRKRLHEIFSSDFANSRSRDCLSSREGATALLDAVSLFLMLASAGLALTLMRQPADSLGK